MYSLHKAKNIIPLGKCDCKLGMLYEFRKRKLSFMFQAKQVFTATLLEKCIYFLLS